MYFLNDQIITLTGAEQLMPLRNWQWSMVCPSMCPLSEQLKVRTSYKRALWVWKGTKPSLLPQWEKASDHFWERSRRMKAVQDSCNKRLLSFCKAFKCHLAIPLTSASTEKQLLPLASSSFPSTPQPDSLLLPGKNLQLLAEEDRAGQPLKKDSFSLFHLLHFRKKRKQETLSSICLQFSKFS